MIRLTDLLAATGGGTQGEVFATEFASFCFDSRVVRQGELFLAVRTDRADGHAFIQQACRDGAAGVLCQEPIDLEPFGATCIVVPDTRRAIQDWARQVLAKQGLDVVGITGSVGKTTAKEAVAAVLSIRYSVFKNRANYNGLYGLPIALGELLPEDRVAVLEIAADRFGEIARLCEIAPPKIAVVTTVEPAHLETFGSLEAIAREKGDLVAALPRDGLAVLNADDPLVLAMASRSPAPVLTFGARISAPRSARPDINASAISVSRDGLRFTVHTPSGRRKVYLPLLGRHQIYAALAAIGVGLARDVPLDDIVARLATLPAVPGRLYPLKGRRGSLLLDDSYSSSPAAAQAALETLDALMGRRRIAVFGDMLELGEYEAAGHTAVGQQAASVVDLLVTKGDRARQIADAARQAGMDKDQIVVTYTAEDAAAAVLDRLAPGDLVLVKGSLATRMEQITRLLMAHPHLADTQLVRQDAAWQQIVTISPDRPTWLEIDLGAIAHNVRRLKVLAGAAQVMISLKADAYGHGAIQVAQTALLNGATWLGVACLSEGLVLREAGIAAPILILGYTPAWQAREIVQHNLTATVFDLEVAHALSRAAVALDRKAPVHLKIDTGMGRLGVFPGEVLTLMRDLCELPGLQVEGIFTHLAVADSTDDWEQIYTREQFAVFDDLLASLAAADLVPPIVHAANSAALLQSPLPTPQSPTPTSQSSIYSLVRTGIAVYGLDPSAQIRCPDDFRPALAWKTQIAQVKTLPDGSHVGYGATYCTSDEEQIAVIPVGYADGFRRAPAHWGEVLVRGQRAPIVGRICMDQTMINVSGIPHVRQGDEVVLIGQQGTARISAEEVASRLGTINYEVVSAILARVLCETLS